MKIFAFAFLIGLTCAHAKVVDRILAVVNSQMVTLSDLTKFQERLANDGLVDKALLSFYDLDKIKSDKTYTLNYLIDTKLIDSAIEKQGIAVPIEAVEGEVRSIAQKSGLTKDQLLASLKKRGIPYSEYQDFIKTSMERQNLLKKEISSKIKISDEDIANFYLKQQKDSKAQVFEYTLAHILFLPSNGGEKAALGRAQSVKEQLSKGLSFNSLAAKYSEDPRFSQGGLFGQVRAGEIIPALEKALVGVREGDTTSIVKMPDGYHIFKVLKRSLVASEEFQRLKSQIADKLFSEIFYRQYETWIQDQRRTAFLKIHGAE